MALQSLWRPWRARSANTADSKAELRVNLSATGALPEHLKARAHARGWRVPTVDALLITASEHRSQLDNRSSRWPDRRATDRGHRTAGRPAPSHAAIEGSNRPPLGVQASAVPA